MRVPWSRLLLCFGRILEVAARESRPLVFPSVARPLFVGVMLVCSVQAGRYVPGRPLFSQANIGILCKGCKLRCEAAEFVILWWVRVRSVQCQGQGKARLGSETGRQLKHVIE